MAKKKGSAAAPAPAAIEPTVTYDWTNKSACFRQASKELGGDTSPTAIMRHLQTKGCEWLKDDDQMRKQSGLVTAALSKGNGKKHVPMDYDAVFAAFEKVKALAESMGGKENLISAIEGASQVTLMASEVGGFDSLRKLAEKV